MAKQVKDPEIEMFYPQMQQQWRTWLRKNHIKKKSVWLICYKKKSGKATISWSDAVDEALCFGWIDSIRKSLDEERFVQFFSQRKASSTWSKVNKEKVQRLVEDGQMTKTGLACIEIAKQNGSWTILDDVEAFVIPKDLTKEFRAHAGSKVFFLGLSKSIQKRILHWIALAKQPQTRQRRIAEIVKFTSTKQIPKQF